MNESINPVSGSGDGVLLLDILMGLGKRLITSFFKLTASSGEFGKIHLFVRRSQLRFRTNA